MNTVKKCSLSGIAFTLEVDAYEALNDYLETLRSQYADETDGEEIVADIEARIAELILSTQDGARTVELPLVKNIIAQMGSAEQIDKESHEEGERESKKRKTESRSAESPRIPRRLYRDPEGAKLGGVCTGLGNYFDLDPVWIRLIFFAPILLAILSRIGHLYLLEWVPNAMGNLFGVFLLGYLIMWFAVPTARTARQRLEMKGEKITAQSIREATAADRSDVDGYPKSVAADTVSAFGLVVLILLKIFAGLIVFGLILLVCALMIGLFAISFHSIPADLFGWSPQNWTGIMGILVVLIPSLLLIYVLMCLIASHRPNGKATLWIFLLWILSFVGLAAAGIYECKRESEANESGWELPAPTRNPDNLLNDAAAIGQAGEAVEKAIEQLENTDSVSMVLTADDGQNQPVRVEFKVSKQTKPENE